MTILRHMKELTYQHLAIFLYYKDSVTSLTCGVPCSMRFCSWDSDSTAKEMHVQRPDRLPSWTVPGVMCADFSDSWNSRGLHPVTVAFNHCCDTFLSPVLDFLLHSVSSGSQLLSLDTRGWAVSFSLCNVLTYKLTTPSLTSSEIMCGS